MFNDRVTMINVSTGPVKGRALLSCPQLIVDTAIGVIATEGMRGLTHRAVDDLADILIGSVSNVYR